MIEKLGSLGDKYIHFVIGISLLIIIILLIRNFLGKKLSKSFVYGMWIMIPLYMLFFPFVRLPMPQVIGDFFNNEIVIEIQESVNEAKKTVENTIIVQYSELEQMTKSMEKIPTHGMAGIQVGNVTQIEMQDEATIKKFNIMTAAICCYFIVLILFMGMILLVNTRFAMQCRKNRKYLCQSPELNIPVYRIKNISSPFLLGKCIYIPDFMEEASSLRYAIMHEESHFRHGDAVWVLLRHLIVGCFFYNPIIWMAFKYSGYDCELACDEAVIERILETERKSYGGCLLNILEKSKRVGDCILLSTNMKSNKKLMKKRIENIVIRSKKSYLMMFLAFVMVFGVLGCALMDIRTVIAKEVDAKQTNMQEYVAEEKSKDIYSETVQNTKSATNTVKYGDMVTLCSEIWTKPTDSEDDTYSFIERERELNLLVKDDTVAFELTDYPTLSDNMVEEILQEICDKKKGDMFTVKKIEQDVEYYFYYTVLAINDDRTLSYNIPPNWSYQLNPIKIKGFFQEDGKEADSGYLYGFEERIKNDGMEWWEGVDKFYTSVYASSELPPQGSFAYAVNNITVPSKYCIWSEGVEGYGIGEWMEMRQLYFGDGEELLHINELCIVNGYAENETKWNKNSRVKKLKFYFENVYMGTIHLEDTIYPQYFDVSELQMYVPNGREACFRFEIEDIYRGSQYEDTCITGIEIGFRGKEEK